MCDDNEEGKCFSFHTHVLILLLKKRNERENGNERASSEVHSPSNAEEAIVDMDICGAKKRKQIDKGIFFLFLFVIYEAMRGGRGSFR